VFYRLRKFINTSKYNFFVKKIFSTPPIKTANKSNILITSMVSHADLIPYLVAIKSFYFFLNQPTAISVLNDGSLTEDDKKILTYHVNPKEIIDIKTIDTGKCPRGGCWERIMYVVENTKDYYVVQLDSDIIALQDLFEIRNNIEKNISYTLKGGIDSGEINTLENAALKAKNSTNTHVQILAEKNFWKHPNFKKLFYVRGCAGFTGFSKNGHKKESVEEFSVNMQKIVGYEKWNQWGSEQIASNFLISNSKGAKVLPYDKYANYYPYEQGGWDKKSLIHFIGFYRYKNGFYLQKSLDIIKILSSN